MATNLKFYSSGGEDPTRDAVLAVSSASNKPFGYTEISAEKARQLGTIPDFRILNIETGQRVDPSQISASMPSIHVIDPVTGNLTTQSAINQEQGYKDAVARGEMVEIAPGKYVPTGSAGDPSSPLHQKPEPVTTLSSLNGQKIVNENIQKLQQMQSSYAGPSIVDYLNSIRQPSDIASREGLAKDAGIKNYIGTAEQNTQLLNLLRAPTNNPAQGQIVNSVNQSIQGGGGTPQDIQNYSNAMDTQNQVFNDMSLAEAAKASGNYSEMDYRIKKAEEGTKALNESLTTLYADMKPLREKQLSLLTPGAREQELAKQVNDIKGQIDQFKIQTEEDKFSEFEGVTMGFAGGRASEIDIRAQFKLQRMATEANTLLTELGLEQDAREMEGKSVEMQIKFLQDNFELQQNVQDKITEMEDSVFDAAKGLRAEAKDTLGMILDSLQGVNPVEIPAQTRAQIQTIASQVGIPFEVIEQGLKAQHAQQVFDNSMRASQEARLASEPGGGTELAPEDERTLAGAGFLPAEIKDIQRAVNDFGIDAVLKTITDQRKKAAIQKAYGVQAGGEQFLTKEYLSKYYTEDELKTNAAEAGFRSVWTNWTSEKEKYLTYLVEQVELKRQAGLTDKEIFKDM